MDSTQGSGGPIVAEDNIINRKAGQEQSLYQICVNLKRRLGEVPGFEPHLQDIIEDEQEDATDPVTSMWRCFRRGYPLITIFNASKPSIPLEVDAARVGEAKVGKAATFKFLHGCMTEFGFKPGDCFLITDLYTDDTNGFVKVAKAVNHVLDILNERGLLYKSDPTAVVEGEQQEPVKLTLRQHIIRELIQTEKDYIGHLEMLQSLKKQLEETGALAGDNIHSIFLNLNNILDFGRRFLIRLEQHDQMPESQQDWGQLFFHYHSAFGVYEPFIANTTRCNAAIEQEWDKISSVKNYSRDLAQIVSNNGILSGFLLKPFQRMTKYPIMLKDLRDKTGLDEEQKVNLTAAIEELNAVLVRANQAVDQEHRRNAVVELHARVDDWKGIKPESFGDLLLFGNFTVLKGDGGKDTEREVRVFFDELDPNTKGLFRFAFPDVPTLRIGGMNARAFTTRKKVTVRRLYDLPRMPRLTRFASLKWGKGDVKGDRTFFMGEKPTYRKEVQISSPDCTSRYENSSGKGPFSNFWTRKSSFSAQSPTAKVPGRKSSLASLFSRNNPFVSEAGMSLARTDTFQSPVATNTFALVPYAPNTWLPTKKSSLASLFRRKNSDASDGDISPVSSSYLFQIGTPTSLRRKSPKRTLYPNEEMCALSTLSSNSGTICQSSSRPRGLSIPSPLHLPSCHIPSTPKNQRTPAILSVPISSDRPLGRNCKGTQMSPQILVSPSPLRFVDVLDSAYDSSLEPNTIYPPSTPLRESSCATPTQENPYPHARLTSRPPRRSPINPHEEPRPLRVVPKGRGKICSYESQLEGSGLMTTKLPPKSPKSSNVVIAAAKKIRDRKKPKARILSEFIQLYLWNGPFSRRHEFLNSDFVSCAINPPRKSWKIMTKFEKKLADERLMIRPFVEQYSIYLFERILLCCKDINPNKQKSNPLSRTRDKPLPNQKGKPKLQLKGRIFMANVTEIISLSKIGSYTIQIFWKGDPGVENFIIRFTNEEQMKKWYQTVDQQRTIRSEERARQTGTSDTEFNYFKNGPQIQNPYAQEDDDHEDEKLYESQQSEFNMSRNASSTSLRSRSATGGSGGSGPNTVRPPRFPMPEPGAPPLSLQTQFSNIMPSPSERGGTSYFSPIEPTPRSSSQSGMYFPRQPTPVSSREAENNRYTAPAMSRVASRESQGSYYPTRAAQRPSLQPMATAQNPQQMGMTQNRMRSASSPDIHNPNLPGSRRYPNGSSAQVDNIPVPPIPPHVAGMRAPVNRSQNNSPTNNLPLRNGTPQYSYRHPVSGQYGYEQIPSRDTRSPMAVMTNEVHPADRVMSPPANGELYMPGQLKAKVSFEDNYVTLVIASNIHFQSLTDRVEAKLARFTNRSIGKNSVRLRYKDEDGDFVTIDSDEAVQEAFLEWKEQHRNMLAAGQMNQVGEIQLFCQIIDAV